MKTVKSFNKNTGVTYVYEVLENYWDKEKKQPRSKRRLIGKIDPETGEVVPTKRKKDSNDEPNYKSLYHSTLKKLEKEQALTASLQQKLDQNNQLLSSLASQISTALKTR